MTTEERKRREEEIAANRNRKPRTMINTLSEEERKRREEEIAANRNRKPRSTVGQSAENNNISVENTSPSVTSSGSGDVYAAGSQRRNTYVDASAFANSSRRMTGRTDMRADEEAASLSSQFGSLPDEERQEMVIEHISRPRFGMSSADIMLKQKQSESKKKWENDKANYNASKVTAKTDAVNNPLDNKYQRMTDEELSAKNKENNKLVEERNEQNGSRVKQIGELIGAVAKDEEYESDPVINNLRTEQNAGRAETTRRYQDKFYSMTDEERRLIATVNAKPSKNNGISQEEIDSARNTLKTKYGYLDDDITAMTYFYNRYANEQRAKKDEVNAKVAMQQNPFLESLSSVPMGIIGGVASLGGIADSYIDNKRVEKIGIEDQGLDYNHQLSRLQRKTQAGRKEFTDTHDLMIGDYDVGDMLYNTALSGLESAATAFIPGGATVLGINAATSKANELSQRGLSSEKAIAGGIAAGAFEVMFESVSLGNIKKLKEVDAKTFKDVALNIAKSSLVNFSEESATEIANIVYDTVAHSDLSEKEIEIQNYMRTEKADGTYYTRDEAEAEVLKSQILQVIESGASGALMGAGFGAVGAGTSYAGNSISLTLTGREAKKKNVDSAIIAEGQAAPVGSENKALADKLAKKKESRKRINNYQLGRLSEMNFETKYVSEGPFRGVSSKEELDNVYETEKVRIAEQEKYGVNRRQITSELKALNKEYDSALDFVSKEWRAERVKKMNTAFAQKYEKKLDEVDRAEATNPTVKTDKGKMTVDGRNFDGKAQKFGEFTGIFTDRDGEKSVKFTNGEKIKFSEAVKMIENRTVKRLWTQAQDMSTETAKLFIENWDGEDIGEYERAFYYYHDMGRTGMSIDNIRKYDTLFGGYLTADAQERIANAGLADREFRKGLTNLSVKQGDDKFEYESKVLKYIGEKNNLEFIILDEDSEVNGKFLAGTNRIIVYRNAEGNILLRTAGHEAFHFIKDNAKNEASKAELKELENFVLDALEKNGIDIENEIERYLGTTHQKEGQVYKTREECIEELVADSMFDVFTNEKFANKLLNENPSLFKKVSDKIKEIIAEIKSAIGMLGNDYAVIKALKDDVDTLDKINSMFDELLTKAGEKYKAEHENGQKNNAKGSATKYSLSVNAKSELSNVLNDKNYNGEILLRDNTPPIMLGRKGVKNLPMVMKASHIRENVLTEEEAKNLGLKINANTHYHGIGEKLFLNIIDSLDNVKEAYRGTPTANYTTRRENYFLLVSEFKDKNGNTVNVPIYINEHAQYNHVFIETNKIATVFGHDDFRNYINQQIQAKNLVRIKNKSNKLSEGNTPLLSHYEDTALDKNSISEKSETVKEKLSVKSSADNLSELKEKQLDIINETNPAPNTYSTWIRTVNDIKTLAETLEDDEWDYDEFNPDLTRSDIQNAIQSGEITVYSSYPIDNGIFVSPSRMEAESYSGDGKVYEKTVDINDVAWIDPTQGQYAKVIKYSTKRTSPAQRQIDILYENRNLKQIISLIDELHYSTVTSDVRLKTKDINLVAKKMLKNLKSKYDVGTLTDELAAVYNYMENSTSENSADEARRALTDLAFKMLEQSEMKDTELYDQYKDVRDYLRNQPIYVTPELKKEIEHQFGDYKSFRNALMGKVMHMTTADSSAPTLDEVWQELSEKAPEYFAKDFNEKDMPLQLAAFFEAIAPKVVNSYEHYSIDVNEVAPIVAEQLQMEYAKIKKVTSKDKDYQDLVFKSNQDFIKAKKAYYEELKQKNEQNKAELYKDYQNKLEEYKSAREETDRRRVLKNRLERNYNYVNRRLVSETDSRHVPENLKKLAEAFKKIVPDSNKTFHESDFIRFENEYRALDNDEFVFFDGNMLERIIAMKEVLCTDDRELKMRELNIEQLEELNNIAEHIKHIVQKENQLFSDRTNASVEDFALNVHGDTQYSPEHYAQEIPDMKYKGKSKDRFRNSIDSFIKGLTKPEYLFSSLGSDTMKFLFDEMRRGENVEAQIIAEAKKYEQETKEKYNYDPRWKNKTIEIELESGKISMTVESAMALYATSKRRQGLQHLLGGGAVIYTKKEIAKDAKTYTEIRKEVIKAAKKNKENLSIKEIDRRALEEYQKNGEVETEIVHRRYYFDKKDIPKIAEALSIDQKQYTDAMVNYITNIIGKKRNEVSMKMFGIEKYKEPYYFPIDVDSHFIDTSIGRQEVVSTIKNQSSSKRTANYAKNPISINGFTDTINQHIYDSALYCAYVVPISDFKRVFNYRGNEFEGEGVESLVTKEFSVKEDLEKANGINAVKQIKDFMVALDSGSRYENLMPVSAKLAAKAKKVSVMANLSVVIQQPTAVFRAMLYVNPKHFATVANKADVEEMKKWNGCALKKEIGYFDVNMGRTATDYINEYSPDKSIKKDWTFKEKLQNGNTMLAIDQVAGWGASKADEMTWGAIWKACKKQVKAENGEFTGDTLNAAAAELFQTVISKTQVYDSVFTKPDYMRRKEGFAMLATQFMSEPLTSLNMLAESVVQSRRAKGSTQQKAARKFCGRAFACYMTSLVVNSALKSLVYTIRDDDEDESFLEKYVANVVGEFIPEALGITMIPYVKDILSIAQGYSLERADVAVFASFKDAIEALGSEKKGAYDKIMAVLKAAGQASGIPAYAVIRDGKAILNIFDKIVDGVQNGFEPTTSRGIINELKETFDWVPGIDSENKYEQLYNAIAEGDEKHYKKVYDNLIADGKTDKAIKSELVSVIVKNDLRIECAVEAMLKHDGVASAEYINDLKNNGFSEELIEKALKNYEDKLKRDVKKKYEEEFINLTPETEEYKKLYEKIIEEYMSVGVKRSDAVKRIKNWYE